MLKKTILLLLAAGLLNGCAGGIIKDDKAKVGTYDFGLPRTPSTAAHIKAQVTLAPVTAPPWLDGQSILYRLAYTDASRLEAYADSRWAAPPAALVMLRLRQALAAIAPDNANTGVADQKNYQLNLNLEEFSQVFDSAQSSRVLLRVHATVSKGNGPEIIAEQTFAIEHLAPSANAEGAVKGLTQADDEMIAKVVEWLGNVPELRK